MPAFLLSFVACMLVTMAGREQLRLARLASVLGVRAGLITAVGISAIVTVTLAAWSGSMLAIAISDASEEIVIAIALLLAALQLAVLRAKPAPKEPTWSFGAMLIVMLVAQICDGARLLVLAFTVHTGEPVLVGAGGALGSMTALLVASFFGGNWERKVPHRALSRTVGAILMLAALIIGISA